MTVSLTSPSAPCRSRSPVPPTPGPTYSIFPVTASSASGEQRARLFTRCSDPTGDAFPRIAPFWTDLDPEFEGGDIFINRLDDDDADADVDRIVITFALGHNECLADECSALVQVQLLENGTVIFGYNGIDLKTP